MCRFLGFVEAVVERVKGIPWRGTSRASARISATNRELGIEYIE
jgi:hypothetical protein